LKGEEGGAGNMPREMPKRERIGGGCQEIGVGQIRKKKKRKSPKKR